MRVESGMLGVSRDNIKILRELLRSYGHSKASVCCSAGTKVMVKALTYDDWGIEQPIPTGQLYRNGMVYRYQLTDHVGSVRAIINYKKLAGGAVDVVYSADYYPFGQVIAAVGIPSRYGYQGEYSEKDSETGWNSFYLRNYDPAIGRWLTVDPYGQYYSPYVGMGNDPINRSDPDGGWSWLNGIGKYFSSWVRGDKPYGWQKRFDGEWGFYTSSGGNSPSIATVIGSANFDSNGTSVHVHLHVVNNAWVPSDFLHLTNSITGESRSLMHTGAIEPVYIESNFIGGSVTSVGKVGWQVLGAAGKVNNAVNYIGAKTVGQGFNFFSAFKRAFGTAGPDQAWHRFVEQTPGNIAKFGNQTVHNTGNLMKLPHGAGTIHAKVSGHYSSILPFTNGQTVRKWLSTQSFQAQYDYGIQTLKNFSWTP